MDDYELADMRKSERILKPCVKKPTKKKITYWSQDNSLRSSLRMRKSDGELKEEADGSEERGKREQNVSTLKGEARKQKVSYEKAKKKVMRMQGEMEEKRKQAELERQMFLNIIEKLRRQMRKSEALKQSG